MLRAGDGGPASFGNLAAPQCRRPRRARLAAADQCSAAGAAEQRSAVRFSANSGLKPAEMLAQLGARGASFVQVQPCPPEQRVGHAPELPEDRPDSPLLNEPAAGARLPHAPATMPPSMPNSTGPMRAGRSGWPVVTRRATRP